MFETKDGKKVDVVEKIKEIVRNVLESTKAYVWEYSEEPFQNKYNGRISYDRSGDVKEATAYDIDSILKETQSVEMWHDSSFQQLLDDLKTGSWQPSYVSGCGKHWTTFGELVEDDYNEWKYENFELYDEDGEELNEDLEIELDSIFQETLNSLNPEDYRDILMMDLPKFNLLETWKIFNMRYRCKCNDDLFKVFEKFWTKLTQLKGEKQLTFTTSEGYIRTFMDEYGFIEHEIASTRGFVLELIRQLHSEDIAGMIIRQKVGKEIDGKELEKVYGIRLGDGEIEYIKEKELRMALPRPKDDENVIEMVSGLN